MTSSSTNQIPGAPVPTKGYVRSCQRKPLRQAAGVNSKTAGTAAVALKKRMEKVVNTTPRRIQTSRGTGPLSPKP